MSTVLRSSGAIAQDEIDDLPPTSQTSELTIALRRVVTAKAVRRLGSPISLDLFASADNTLVPVSSHDIRSRSPREQTRCGTPLANPGSGPTWAHRNWTDGR